MAPCIRDERRQKVAVGSAIPCYSEREVFETMGLQYKEPWERNCFDEGNMIADPDKVESLRAASGDIGDHELLQLQEQLHHHHHQHEGVRLPTVDEMNEDEEEIRHIGDEIAEET